MIKTIPNNGFVFAAALCLGMAATTARGGDLTPTSGPMDPNSAMFTLNDIYTKLVALTTNVTRRTGGFTEPSGTPTNGTMHTLNEIMAQTIQWTNRAPVARTGQTISYTPYDDGWYSTNLGVAWPVPRFTTNGTAAASNCVTDRLTGLMWLKNPDATTRTWSNAIAYCESLDGADGRGGYTDWRLPNWQELRSQLDASCTNPSLSPDHPSGSHIVNGNYWSSTTYMYTKSSAEAISLWSFNYVWDQDKANTYYVWPVRGGR